MSQNLSISEVVARTGLTADTLRYYEKIGLIERVRRAGSGHRIYDGTDITWLEFLIRLRETGMPIAVMCHYAELRRTGHTTLAQRRELLQAHVVVVQGEIQRLNRHLERLSEKIEYYREEEAGMASQTLLKDNRHV